MIIGLTGTFGSGKGTIAKYLKEKKFGYYSCSDYLRNELDKQGIEKSIENLANLGNKIRKEFGAGELTKRLLIQMKEDNAVFDSLRHPEEINVLKGYGNFHLIAIDAPIRLRYSRAKSRGRIGDDISFEEFEEQERKQMDGKGSNMQLSKCISMAEYKLYNDKDISYLREGIEKIFQDIIS